MTNLDYIQSTGTQYINTGIPSASNLKVDITYATSGSTLYHAVLGCRGNSKNFYYLNADGSNYGTKEFGWVSGNQKFSPSISTHNIKTNLVWDGYNLTFTNAQGTYTKSLGSSTFSGGLNLFLFGFNDNGSVQRIGTTNIYSCKIYSGGTLVRDFIPVKDENDVVCLYDNVSSSYFYNAGTGDFVAGDQPQLIEYIQSSGTQYIDTGIKENQAYAFEMTFLPTSLVENYQSYLGGTLDNFTIGSYSTLGQIYIRHRSSEVAKPTVSTSTPNSLSIKDNKATLNGTTVGTPSTANPLSTASTYNICVFANGSNTPRKSGMRLYGLKLYDANGALLRDFVPAKDGNDVACLYDNVSGAFFYNAGTGDFTAGPAIATQKYLLESGGNYYSVISNVLTNVGSTLNAQLFADYGMDDIPDWSDYSSLTAPTILCWNSTESVDMEATTTGLPSPQAFVSDAISLTVQGTAGIEGVEITEDGSPTYAFSVDGGTTWKIWSGSAWVTSSGTDMSSATVEALTNTEWNSLTSGASTIKVRFTLASASDAVEEIKIGYKGA